MERKQDTDTRILLAAASIVREDGPDRLTFDRVASRVGVTKQAVLYWYPNKARLIEALVRPSLELEAICGEDAVKSTRRADTAIRAFVEAIASFHVSDLDRFRLMYVSPQIGRHPARGSTMLSTLGRIHPATTRMYDALAEKLVKYGRYEKLVDARRGAGAMHTAVLGTILRMAMADTLRAPLRHRDDALISALIDVLAPPVTPSDPQNRDLALSVG
mgnify:CR=1 FL=1